MSGDVIDVIACVHGRAAWTYQAMQALMATSPVRRFIIVDNAAEHPGLSHARLAGHPLVDYVPSDNVGLFRAHNRALERVQTRYVAILVSDSIYLPGWYEAARAAIEHGLVWVSPQQQNVTAFTPHLPWAALRTRDTQHRLVIGEYLSGNALFDWSTLREQIGWFDEDFFVCWGDYDWQVRLDDGGFRYGVTYPPRAMHLMDLSRTSFTAEMNVMVEQWDETVFRQKYAARPDVLARFPSDPVSAEEQIAYWRDRGLL